VGRHKDKFVSVAEIVGVNSLLGDAGWHIRLETPATGERPVRIVSD